MHEMCPTWEPETIMVDRGISASVYTDIFPQVNILHCCKHFLDISAGNNLTEPGAVKFCWDNLVAAKSQEAFFTSWTVFQEKL